MKARQQDKDNSTIQSHYSRIEQKLYITPFSIIYLYKNMKLNNSSQSLDMLKISPVELKNSA